MSPIVATFDVPIKGIGKPDYSREISSGIIRPGLTLKYRQSLLTAGITFTPIVSLFPWIRPVLAPGGIAHLIDWETGLPLPYTCDKGYAYTLVTVAHSATQDHVLRIYLSTPELGIPLSFVGNYGTIASGQVYDAADVVEMSTVSFDPNALYSHGVDFVVENLGLADLEGSCTITAIQEAIGTPQLPPDKTVKCKWCGHERVVPRETTYTKCPNCGQFNIYCDFSKIKRLG